MDRYRSYTVFGLKLAKFGKIGLIETLDLPPSRITTEYLYGITPKRLCSFKRFVNLTRYRYVYSDSHSYVCWSAFAFNKESDTVLRRTHPPKPSAI